MMFFCSYFLPVQKSIEKTNLIVGIACFTAIKLDRQDDIVLSCDTVINHKKYKRSNYENCK